MPRDRIRSSFRNVHHNSFGRSRRSERQRIEDSVVRQALHRWPMGDSGDRGTHFGDIASYRAIHCRGAARVHRRRRQRGRRRAPRVRPWPLAKDVAAGADGEDREACRRLRRPCRRDGRSHHRRDGFADQLFQTRSGDGAAVDDAVRAGGGAGVSLAGASPGLARRGSPAHGRRSAWWPRSCRGTCPSVCSSPSLFRP